MRKSPGLAVRKILSGCLAQACWVWLQSQDDTKQAKPSINTMITKGRFSGLLFA